MVLDFTKTVQFIKAPATTNGRHYRVFEIFIAAILGTIVLGPELNRFGEDMTLEKLASIVNEAIVE